MNLDVRERSREILQAQLADAAADFCLEHGFENVTVDEIAQGIGISRATFFRYFASKEEAIIAAIRPDHRTLGEHVHGAEPSRGAVGMDVVRSALTATITGAERNPARLRALFRMIGETPSLRARTAFSRTEQRESLSEALGEHIDDPEEARAVATAGMAALELAWSLWGIQEDAGFGEVLDRAFALVGRVGQIRIDG